MRVAPGAAGDVVAVAGAIEILRSGIEPHLARERRGRRGPFGRRLERLQPARIGERIRIQQRKRLGLRRGPGREIVASSEADILAEPYDLRDPEPGPGERQ
jgi:hypothetical protein